MAPVKFCLLETERHRLVFLFFFSVFSDYSYEEIMTYVLDTLLSLNIAESEISVEIPLTLIESFGQECRKAGLVDDLGHFHDPYKLVTFFCQ